MFRWPPWRPRRLLLLLAVCSGAALNKGEVETLQKIQETVIPPSLPYTPSLPHPCPPGTPAGQPVSHPCQFPSRFGSLRSVFCRRYKNRPRTVRTKATDGEQRWGVRTGWPAGWPGTWHGCTFPIPFIPQTQPHPHPPNATPTFPTHPDPGPSLEGPDLSPPPPPRTAWITATGPPKRCAGTTASRVPTRTGTTPVELFFHFHMRSCAASAGGAQKAHGGSPGTLGMSGCMGAPRELDVFLGVTFGWSPAWGLRGSGA